MMYYTDELIEQSSLNMISFRGKPSERMGSKTPRYDRGKYENLEIRGFSFLDIALWSIHGGGGRF